MRIATGKVYSTQLSMNRHVWMFVIDTLVTLGKKNDISVLEANINNGMAVMHNYKGKWIKLIVFDQEWAYGRSYNSGWSRIQGNISP